MDSSPLLSLHQAAHARLQSAPPHHVLTYGDVPAEYQAARAGAVLFDDTDRTRLRIAGPDAESFLHRILSSHVKGLTPGRGQRALLLSAKGKVLFDFELYRTEAGYTLSIPAARAAALAAALDMYLFSEKLSLTQASADYAPIVLTGPRTDAILEQAFRVTPPAEPYAHIQLDGLILARTLYAGQPAVRIVAAPERVPELWKQLCDLGAQPAGLIVRDILRVEQLAPLFGVDIDDSIYPQEARLEDAFALDKGCYIGQEVVAKIDTYGGLNKRICALKLDSDDPVAPGTRLYRLDEGEWRDLGVITTWAYSFVHDTGAVLAYLKRRHQDVGTVFRVGDGPGTATVTRS
jgi:folate-binding protein YgfZ